MTQQPKLTFDPYCTCQPSRLPTHATPAPGAVLGRQRAEELRREVEETHIAAYLDMFEEEVREEQLHIGSISLQDVHEEERRLREEHVRYASALHLPPPHVCHACS